MRYLGCRSSVITVRTRQGFWASRRQAEYLATRLCLLIGEQAERLLSVDENTLDAEHYVSGKGILLHTAISLYLNGDAFANRVLIHSLTPAEFRMLSEVADFLSQDPTGTAGDGRAYVACNLNTGYNLVLVPR